MLVDMGAGFSGGRWTWPQSSVQWTTALRLMKSGDMDRLCQSAHNTELCHSDGHCDHRYQRIVMTMPRRLPGRLLLIPPLPLETSDCAGPTAVSLNPHQPLVEPLYRNREKPSENMQNTIDAKQRGRNEWLWAIQEAINPRAKRPGGTQAGSELPRKRTRKAVNISGTKMAQAQEMIMKLSPEQAQILKVVEGGANAGSTGKSLLLCQIIKSLKMKYPARPNEISHTVAITASTRLAASNIEGITLNSFAGIGQGEGSAEHFISGMPERLHDGCGQRFSLWMKVSLTLLTLDMCSPFTVSMVDGGLFDKLSQISNTCWEQAIPNTFNLTQVF
ncbi:hypothetical protein B0H10DRAFT_1975126 [Mycena sp. CBHHK59/15]|nr:hypothetical protein B0H10DRAFT_1975126 [Mycena sp. CBHHK59/15]